MEAIDKVKEITGINPKTNYGVLNPLLCGIVQLLFIPF
jgi:hypothetical protein